MYHFYRAQKKWLDLKYQPPPAKNQEGEEKEEHCWYITGNMFNVIRVIRKGGDSRGEQEAAQLN